MPYQFDKNDTIAPLIDIARGHYNEFRPVQLFGFNRSVGTDFETIYNNGGGLYPFPAAAGTISAVSSAADTMGVYIEGLDANYAPISETITLTGTTPAIGSKSFLRVNKARITASNNAGNITLTIGSDTVAYIEATTGTHQAIAYTTPADTKLFIAGVSFASGTVNPNKYLTGRACIETQGGPELHFWQSTWSLGFLQFDVKMPFVIPPRTDFSLEVKSSSGENEIDCFVNAFLEADGWIVDALAREWE